MCILSVVFLSVHISSPITLNGTSQTHPSTEQKKKQKRIPPRTPLLPSSHTAYIHIYMFSFSQPPRGTFKLTLETETGTGAEAENGRHDATCHLTSLKLVHVYFFCCETVGWLGVRVCTYVGACVREKRGLGACLLFLCTYMRVHIIFVHGGCMYICTCTGHEWMIGM
jgi:hypothetical protein